MVPGLESGALEFEYVSRLGRFMLPTEHVSIDEHMPEPHAGPEETPRDCFKAFDDKVNQYAASLRWYCQGPPNLHPWSTSTTTRARRTLRTRCQGLLALGTPGQVDLEPRIQLSERERCFRDTIRPWCCRIPDRRPKWVRSFERCACCTSYRLQPKNKLTVGASLGAPLGALLL